MNLAHSVKDFFLSIPDKWIAVFLFMVCLVYHHFHPDEFVKSLINNFQGAILTALTIGFKRQENAMAKKGDTVVQASTTEQAE